MNDESVNGAFDEPTNGEHATDAPTQPAAPAWKPRVVNVPQTTTSVCQSVSLTAAPGGVLELTLRLTLDAAAAALVEAERCRRRQHLAERVRQLALASPAHAAWLEMGQKIRDAEREKKRLLRALEDLPEERTALLSDTDAGAAIAARLADLSRRETALRQQADGLDFGLRTLREELARRAREVEKAAVAIATAEQAEALAGVERTERDLHGLGERCAGDLNALALAQLLRGDVAAFNWPEAIGRQVARELAAPPPTPQPVPRVLPAPPASAV
jgi:hypothetical protein